MRCVDEGACYRALAVWGQYSAISRWANVSANTVSLWCAARLPAGAGRGGRGVGSIDHTRVFDCRRMRIAHAAGHGFGHFHVCPVVPDTTQPPRPHRSRSRAPRHGRVLLIHRVGRSQLGTRTQRELFRRRDRAVHRAVGLQHPAGLRGRCRAPGRCASGDTPIRSILRRAHSSRSQPNGAAARSFRGLGCSRA